MATNNTLSCQELVELVTEYLEGTLAATDRARFEAHLATCEGCAIYLEQMRQTIRLLGTLTEDDVPSSGRERLLEVFGDWRRR